MQRLEDPLPQLSLHALPGHFLDHEPGQGVDGVAVPVAHVRSDLAVRGQGQADEFGGCPVPVEHPQVRGVAETGPTQSGNSDRIRRSSSTVISQLSATRPGNLCCTESSKESLASAMSCMTSAAT